LRATMFFGKTFSTRPTMPATFWHFDWRTNEQYLIWKIGMFYYKIEKKSRKLPAVQRHSSVHSLFCVHTIRPDIDPDWTRASEGSFRSHKSIW
jgi:hypothetical protein